MLCFRALKTCVCCVYFMCLPGFTPLLHPALCTRGTTSKDSLFSALGLGPAKWETQQETGRREERKEGHSISSLDSLPEQLPVWDPKWQSQVLSWWPFSSHSLILGTGNHSSASSINCGYWMCSALHFSFHYLFVILEYIYGFWNSFLEMWIKKNRCLLGTSSYKTKQNKTTNNKKHSLSGWINDKVLEPYP